jgi:hypothetical protein
MRAPGHSRLLIAGAVVAVMPAVEAAASGRLAVHTIASVHHIGDSVIVGRARCADSTWLLNEAGLLVSLAGRVAPAVQRVRGFARTERPWGLACLADGALWTLATARTLARLGPDGSVGERVRLPAPWIQVYGAGDRLLFEPLPARIGMPLLSAVTPTRVQEANAWRGLNGRPGQDGIDGLTVNLVTCGLSRDRTVPCWFPSEATVVVSDGMRARRYSFEWIKEKDVNRAAPLRDVAHVEGERIWLLPSSTRLEQGRRVGSRIVLATRGGHELARLDLEAPARLIVSATAVSCVVLTVAGELVEVILR